MMVRLKPKIVETLGSDTMVINPKSFYALDRLMFSNKMES